jgi:hypothetical protein
MAIGKDTLKKMHEETTFEDVLDHGPSVGRCCGTRLTNFAGSSHVVGRPGRSG